MTVFDIKNSRNYAAVVMEGAMRVFPVVSSESDPCREMTAFRPPDDFPMTAECEVVTVKIDGARLNNHAHSHVEGFFLIAGSCVVRTWTDKEGVKQQKLLAPIMFTVEPYEEHLLTCSKGTVLMSYTPINFLEKNYAAATHL